MPCTVFYSWQSDTEQRVNRYFLKDCLSDALVVLADGDNLDEVTRGGELHLDHDTNGVYGDVDVLATIFEKITACDIFVADITIVAKTADGKQCPNPNVLLELGYAIEAAGPERTIKVMNEHYGAAKAGLPFDMAHKRFPLCYTLAPDAGKAEKAKIRKQVAREFADIISGMLRETGPKALQKLEFQGVEPAWKSSSFISDGLLGRDARSAFRDELTDVRWDNGPQWFLRVIPQKGLQSMTTKVIMDHLNNQNLPPLGGNSRDYMPTSRGGVCYELPVGAKPVKRFTQLFNNGELWGIEQPNNNARENKFIPFGIFVSSLQMGLEAYLGFVRDRLGVEPPLQIIAGLSDVEGFRIADERFTRRAGFSPFDGLCPKEEIVAAPITIKTYDVSVEDLLGPFFQQVWEEFGLSGEWNAMG